MAKTIEQQAIEALKTALDAMDGDPTVYLDREKTISVASLPAVNLVIQGSTPEEFVGAGVEAHRLSVLVAMYDQATGSETITQQLSTLRGDVRKAVLADHTLGGLVVDVEETECDIDAADVDGAPDAGGSAIAFSVLIWTKPGDPYAAAP